MRWLTAVLAVAVLAGLVWMVAGRRVSESETRPTIGTPINISPTPTDMPPVVPPESPPVAPIAAPPAIRTLPSPQAVAQDVEESVAEPERWRGTPIPYRVIPMEDFAAFVKNWGNAKFFTEVLRSLDDWNKAFSSAVVMDDARPTAPDEAFFEKELLLMVASVGPPAVEGENPLSVVFLEDAPRGAWSFRVLTWLYEPPEPVDGGMTVKHTLLLAVPKEYIPKESSAVAFFGQKSLQAAIREAKEEGQSDLMIEMLKRRAKGEEDVAVVEISNMIHMPPTAIRQEDGSFFMPTPENPTPPNQAAPLEK